MNFKHIAVFDFETNGKEPETCNIVQIGCIMIEPRTLKIVEGSEFNLNMKPDFSTNEDGALEFHKKRLKLNSKQELLDMWETYPDPQVVWPEFVTYLKRYHKASNRQSMHTAPIPAGANIMKFDLPIAYRYHNMFGDKKTLFHPRDRIDLLDWFFMWFENNKDITGYSMDFIRNYLGMDQSNAHDALQDVKDCAKIIQSFMALTRRKVKSVRFNGVFKK
jgi:DNA polymerase III epsilon subunit-like protein